jgi:hypothetical protein
MAERARFELSQFCKSLNISETQVKLLADNGLEVFSASVYVIGRNLIQPFHRHYIGTEAGHHVLHENHAGYRQKTESTKGASLLDRRFPRFTSQPAFTPKPSFTEAMFLAVLLLWPKRQSLRTCGASFRYRSTVSEPQQD